MKRAYLIAGVVSAVLALAACGQKTETQAEAPTPPAEPAAAPAATPTGTYTVDVGRVTRRYLGLGALVPLAIGVVGVGCGVSGAGLTDSGTGTRVAAAVLGAVFLVIAAGIYYLLAAHPPQRFLEVGPDGVALRGGRVDWSAPWQQLRDPRLVRTRLTVRRSWTARGVALLPTFPRWYLVLGLADGTFQDVDLGPGHGVRREVQEAFGDRLRVDAARTLPPSRRSADVQRVRRSRP